MIPAAMAKAMMAREKAAYIIGLSQCCAMIRIPSPMISPLAVKNGKSKNPRTKSKMFLSFVASPSTMPHKLHRLILQPPLSRIVVEDRMVKEYSRIPRIT